MEDNAAAEEWFTGHNEGISSLRKRHRKARKKQFCRPVKTPFNSDKFAEFILKLDRLKNLNGRDPTKSGQYIIRASCMGKVYGHFLSGVVDMAALVAMTRAPVPGSHSSNTKDACPDIDVSETIVLHVLYKELIDNPVVLTLLDGRHPCKAGNEEPDFYHLAPIGYMCLDLLDLVNNEMGFVDEYIEPWILQNEKRPDKFNCGTPMLQFSVSCSGGLPEQHHLRNGNSMSLFVEAMYRLPEEILHLEKFRSEMNVFITLPVSDSEPYLVFPRGQFLDENGHSHHHHHHHKSHNRTKSGRIKEMFQRNSARAPHWASVLEHWPEIPKSATVIPGSSWGDPEKELSGDMLTSTEEWKDYLTSSDPQIIWDSLRKIYIPANTYQKTLQDLSKNSTWPLEVSITINKEISAHKSSAASAGRHGSAENSEHSSDLNRKKSGTTPSATNNARDTLATGSAYTPTTRGTRAPANTSNSEEPRFETIIVYHGIAFVDLTQLLSPGTKSIRFASRLVPYQDKLLLQKTIIRQSAFLSSIPGYLESKISHLPSASNSKHTQKKNASAYTPKDKTHDTRSRVDHHGHHGHGNANEIKVLLENKPSKDIMEVLTARESTTNMKPVEVFPFIVFELTMDHPIIPLYSKDDTPKTVKDYITDPDRSFPRRKVMNSKMAVAKYRRSILQASAELCEIFHNEYLEEVVNDPRNAELAEADNPASSCDALKKGFLFYLNATGRYLILREHLRNAISHIIQQRCLVLRPNGFQNTQDFQSYLHDMYMYLVDQMHDILTKTQMNEVDPFVSLSRLEEKRRPESEQSKVVEGLRNYAEEALAQGDFDNCHRIHLERICKSEEDPNAWVDFATMWLSRGDDRMAEIAVREALRINPEHVYALIMAGVIAAKHEDERAIDCIGTAFSFQPTSPECMVILAMVYKTMNNDVAADYYFKYARYMHRVLTGGDVTNMDNDFKKLNTGFDALNASGSKANYEELMKLKENENLSKSDHEILTSSIMPTSLRLASSDPRSHKVKQSSKSKIDSKSLKIHHELKRVPSKTPGTGLQGNVKEENVLPTIKEEKEKNANVENEPSFVRRESISGKTKPRKNSNFVLPHILRPNFQFETEFNEELLSKSLPPLGPSLQTPWDVTQTSTVPKPFKFVPKKHVSIAQEDEEEAIPTVVDEEHEIVNVHETQHERKGSPEVEKQKSIEENLHQFAAQFDDMYGDDKVTTQYSLEEEEDEEEENEMFGEELEDQIGSQQNIQLTSQESAFKKVCPENIPNLASPENIPKRVSPGNTSKKGSPPGKIPSAGPPEQIRKEELSEKERSLQKASKQEISQEKPSKVEIPPDTNPTKWKLATPKVYSKKNGSEYIWTAQLLLQLRLFDFMDGVLAREVHLNEKRNIQYLYLRSISLYLRHRSTEALNYINEAIDLDPMNATLWALKGHCYYRMNKHIEALESYERSLMLPNDKNSSQHLVYLRFGSLCLDQGGEEECLHLAKKVFQRGVHMYPSPYMWLAYGNTCYQMKQFEEAENAFAEANRVDNTSPLIWAHLSLVSLALDNQTLAEQSYKWAIRFGLRKGPMVEEIKRLQKEKGFGDPSFPRIPDCLPHDFYLRRVGRQLPFDMYKEALYNAPPRRGKKKYYDTERELELKRRLEENKRTGIALNVPLLDDSKQKDATDAEEEDPTHSDRYSIGTVKSKMAPRDKKKGGALSRKQHEETKPAATKDKVKRNNSHGINKKSTTEAAH